MNNAININVLAEAKHEYTSQLKNILTPQIYMGIKSMYNASKEFCKKTGDKNTLKKFQIILRQTPQWEQSKINNEFNRIEKSTKCDYIEDLLTALFISHTKVLASIKLKKKSKSIEMDVPTGPFFVHKLYIECARIFWKYPYLFHGDFQNLELQRNLFQSEELIKEAITETIRKMLPVKDVLKEYLGNDYDDDNDEDITSYISNSTKNNIRKMIKLEIDETLNQQTTYKKNNLIKSGGGEEINSTSISIDINYEKNESQLETDNTDKSNSSDKNNKELSNNDSKKQSNDLDNNKSNGSDNKELNNSDNKELNHLDNKELNNSDNKELNHLDNKELNNGNSTQNVNSDLGSMEARCVMGDLPATDNKDDCREGSGEGGGSGGSGDELGEWKMTGDADSKEKQIVKNTSIKDNIKNIKLDNNINSDNKNIELKISKNIPLKQNESIEKFKETNNKTNSIILEKKSNINSENINMVNNISDIQTMDFDNNSNSKESLLEQHFEPTGIENKSIENISISKLQSLEDIRGNITKRLENNEGSKNDDFSFFEDAVNF